MLHITWMLSEYAIKRKDATKSTAMRFAKYAESQWGGDKSTAELWEDFKKTAWSLNQSGVEEE
jgi:hypothetical protein